MLCPLVFEMKSCKYILIFQIIMHTCNEMHQIENSINANWTQKIRLKRVGNNSNGRVFQHLLRNEMLTLCTLKSTHEILIRV